MWIRSPCTGLWAGGLTGPDGGYKPDFFARVQHDCSENAAGPQLFVHAGLVSEAVLLCARENELVCASDEELLEALKKLLHVAFRPHGAPHAVGTLLPVGQAVVDMAVVDVRVRNHGLPRAGRRGAACIVIGMALRPQLHLLPNLHATCSTSIWRWYGPPFS